MHYLIQPRDRIFVKSYELLSAAKNMSKNIGKNISESLSGKYSQYKYSFDHAKQSATDALKTSTKWVIPKTAEVTGDLIGNKIARVSKTSQQNNSETFTSENDK